MKEIIQCLKNYGITFEDIITELDYRDESPNSNWDDNLCFYLTEELIEMEQNWNK